MNEIPPVQLHTHTWDFTVTYTQTSWNARLPIRSTMYVHMCVISNWTLHMLSASQADVLIMYCNTSKATRSNKWKYSTTWHMGWRVCVLHSMSPLLASSTSHSSLNWLKSNYREEEGATRTTHKVLAVNGTQQADRVHLGLWCREA